MSPPVNSHNHEEQEAPDQRKSFWGIRCEGGNVYSRMLSKRCNMTMAALEPNTCRAENPWVSLLMERGGSEFLLCSLKNDFIMQVNLNLIFEKGEKIKFYVRGQGTVHLSGYQEGSSADIEDDDIIDKQVKIPTATENYSTVGKNVKKGYIYCQLCNLVIKSEQAWMEHIEKKKHMKNFKRHCASADKSPVKKNKNMPSTSKAVSSDEEDSEIQEIPPNMPSGSGGKAGSSGEQVRTILSKSLIKVITDSADSEDNEEEDKDFNEFDEEESDYDEEDSEEEDELDEDDDSDNSGDMVNRTLEIQKRKRESDASDSRKRAKKDNSVLEASTSGASQMPIEIFEVDDDQNTSEEDSNDSSEDEESTFKKSPLIKAQTSNKKKKSNDGAHQGDSNSKPNAGKAENSVDIHDLRVGYGPPAKPGKTVQVFYTGRFPNGKIFDQTPVGKPFIFKLGAGQVIKGWDIGIEGMKVGGKRKITVPPHLGYGNKDNDEIPANSTLIFHVELKSIS